MSGALTATVHVQLVEDEELEARVDPVDGHGLGTGCTRSDPVPTQGHVAFFEGSSPPRLRRRLTGELLSFESFSDGNWISFAGYHPTRHHVANPLERGRVWNSYL